MKYKFDLYDLNGNLIEKDVPDHPVNFTGIIYGACIHQKGRVWYFKNGELHRKDGPAYYEKDEQDEMVHYQYRYNGEHHRLGGPCFTNINKEECYYVYNKPCTKEEHDLLHSIIKLRGLLL